MKKVLIVKAKRNGYRRCGYGFSDTSPTEIPLDKLSAEEIETLTNDSGLIVVEAGEGEAAAAAIKSETRKEVAALQAKLKASEEALAAAEQLQLLGDIGWELAGQAGELARQARAIGRMAGSTGGHIALGDAAAPDLLAA